MTVTCAASIVAVSPSWFFARGLAPDSSSILTHLWRPRGDHRGSQSRGGHEAGVHGGHTRRSRTTVECRSHGDQVTVAWPSYGRYTRRAVGALVIVLLHGEQHRRPLVARRQVAVCARIEQLLKALDRVGLHGEERSCRALRRLEIHLGAPVEQHLWQLHAGDVAKCGRRRLTWGATRRRPGAVARRLTRRQRGMGRLLEARGTCRHSGWLDSAATWSAVVPSSALSFGFAPAAMKSCSTSAYLRGGMGSEFGRDGVG